MPQSSSSTSSSSSSALYHLVLDSHPIPLPLSPALRPLHFRPILALALIPLLLTLALLGFHPTIGSSLPSHSDKLLHFLGFTCLAALFYSVWDIPDDSTRRVWLWRRMPRILTLAACSAASILSEVVQAALPYKTFQIGDVLANLMGSALGVYGAEVWEHSRRSRQELARLYLPLDEDLPQDQMRTQAAHDLESGTHNMPPQSPRPFAIDDSDDEIEEAAYGAPHNRATDTS